MNVLRMADLDLRGKRVMIREDLNVPLTDGKVSSDARIRAALPTLERALAGGAAVIVLSHLGRPIEGETGSQFSLQPIANHLGALLGREVPLIRDWLDGLKINPGEIALCENVRFNRGEQADDETLSRKMAGLCDVFVMDAFGTAHRAHASTHGVAKHAPIACAGPLLAAELSALGQALKSPRSPVVAIVGGAKVSTKLEVLRSLLGVVDQLIVGGGIANTFIAAAGHNVGVSLYEESLVDTARDLIAAAATREVQIPIPADVVVGKSFSADTEVSVRAVDAVAADEMILDLGPETTKRLAHQLQSAGTIVWNGPVGVFELEPFAGGTEGIARAIAASTAFSIAGGGDTLAAVDRFGISEDVSYISTGGGAFLEFLEGKTLPAVAVLEARARD